MVIQVLGWQGFAKFVEFDSLLPFSELTVNEFWTVYVKALGPKCSNKQIMGQTVVRL